MVARGVLLNEYVCSHRRLFYMKVEKELYSMTGMLNSRVRVSAIEFAV